MSPRIEVETERTLYTYVQLRCTSYYSLNRAQEGAHGKWHYQLITILFSAFCLEAYLNHLGASLFESWPSIELAMSPEEKLQLLAKEVKLKYDPSKRPFQSFPLLFEFRNKLVHGKTVSMRQQKKNQRPIKSRPTEPKADWERLITHRQAERFFDDTRFIIEALHIASGGSGDPLAIAESGSWVEKGPKQFIIRSIT